MTTPQEIVVQFEESSGLIKIVLKSTSDESSGEFPKEFEFALMRIAVNDLTKMPVESAERMFGATILEALGQVNSKLRVLRKQELTVVDLADPAHQEIERRAKGGDHEAQNAYGLVLLEKSLLNVDESLLEEAEHWFQEAARQGNVDASDFLRDAWGVVKSAQAKKIRTQRSSGSNGPAPT